MRKEERGGGGVCVKRGVEIWPGWSRRRDIGGGARDWCRRRRSSARREVWRIEIAALEDV